MNAICGLIHFDNAPADPSLLHQMADAGIYRPGVASHPVLHQNVAFASLSPAEPPLLRDSFWLVADCRLDNRAELIRQLNPPAEQPSDNELILAAYQRWGQRCVEYLQGAYAIAIWDGGQLFLCRDVMGERGLYWAFVPGRFLFASEPTQLLTTGLVPSEPHPEQMLAYLLRGRPDPTWTFYRHIYRLPEGHTLTTAGEQPALHAYWDWGNVRPERWSRPDAARALAAHLHRAVANRLPSQGETAVLLSGGLDSLSVTAQAADQRSSLHAFTWSSTTGDAIDERPRSSLFISSRPNIQEQVIIADDLGLFSRYPEAYADGNSPESNAFPDLLLTTLEQARQTGVSVLLSGAGGDYFVGGTAPDLALLFGGNWLTLARRWRQSGLRHSLVFHQIRLLTRRYAPEWLTPTGRALARATELDRPFISWRALLSHRAFRRFLISQPANARLLERADQLSRRAGIRLAAPWHDQAIARFILSLPDTAVDIGPPGKTILREAMAGQLPERLRLAPIVKERPTRLGLEGVWQSRPHIAEKLLLASPLADVGLVDIEKIRYTVRHAPAQGPKISRLWEILTLACWLQTLYNGQNFISGGNSSHGNESNTQ